MMHDVHLLQHHVPTEAELRLLYSESKHYFKFALSALTVTLDRQSFILISFFYTLFHLQLILIASFDESDK
jgi:hypothetical protein